MDLAVLSSSADGITQLWDLTLRAPLANYKENVPALRGEYTCAWGAEYIQISLNTYLPPPPRNEGRKKGARNAALQLSIKLSIPLSNSGMVIVFVILPVAHDASILG